MQYMRCVQAHLAEVAEALQPLLLQLAAATATLGNGDFGKQQRHVDVHLLLTPLPSSPISAVFCTLTHLLQAPFKAVLAPQAQADHSSL